MRSQGLFVATMFAAGALAAFSGCDGSERAVPLGAGALLTSVKARIVVKFPPHNRARRRGRAPRYVSASTRSVVFTLTAVNGGGIPAGFTASQTVSLGSDCSGSGPYTCSTSWTVPAGSDAFTVRAFDGSDGSGNLLSTNALTQTVSRGSSNISVTLWGVPASIALTGGSSVLGTEADGFTLPFAATAYPFTVTLDDADGNTIVGAGAPSFTVSVSGTAYAATTPVPGADTFSITPQSTAVYRSATVTVTAVYPTSGPTPYPTSCPSAACQVSAGVVAGQLLFTAPSSGLQVYSPREIESALAGNTDVAALNSIAFTSNGYGVAFDAAGDMFGVSYGATAYAYTAALVKEFMAGTAVSPSGSLRLGVQPVDCQIDASGNLYVSNSGSDTVSVFAASALAKALTGSTDVAQTGSLSAGSVPYSMAFDSKGDLFVTADGASVVNVYAPSALASALAGSSGVAPSGSLSTGGGSTHIAADASGDIFVSGAMDVIDVYSASAAQSAVGGSTNVAVTGTLSTGSATSGVTLDPSGNLFAAAISSSVAVVVFSKATVASAVAGGTNLARSGTFSNAGYLANEVAADQIGDVFVGCNCGAISVYAASSVTSAVGGTTGIAPTGSLAMSYDGAKMRFGP